MIINIRGTSGSGKTTVVTRLMEDVLRGKTNIMIPNRKKPFAYTFSEPTKVALMGHYESVCGGCDTINTFDQCYEGIAELDIVNDYVLYEGLRQSSDFKRINDLFERGHEILVVNLKVDLETCLESVQKRREARGAY